MEKPILIVLLLIGVAICIINIYPVLSCLLIFLGGAVLITAIIRK